MKISYNWLKEYIHPIPDAVEVAKLLTNCGLEVEGMETIETVKGGLRGLVIGEVKTRIQHPNADRLSLTTVDIGTGSLLNIVCGGPNVAAGQKVVIAPVGVTLHPVEGDPFEIKKSKIRGEASEGMICAEDEIGLGKSHEGIMVLDSSAVVGTAARDYFKVKDDIVFEIGLTPNHADAASHYGVARELYAVIVNHLKPEIRQASDGSKTEISLASVSGFKVDDNSLLIPVEVKDTTACPRYSGITVSNVIVAESPAWLQERLKAIALAPINNIVDITNFVLHECGQPLHAFDADDIKGGKIVVKLAGQGEKFITLDEVERNLSPADLMICNTEDAMCIAGVFGGIKSGIKLTTKNVFIESAYFNPGYIRKTSKHHGLHTDASFRFERGTDPEMVIYALKRAAMLMKEIAGGKISSGIIDIYPKPLLPARIKVNYPTMDRLAGMKIERQGIKNILQSLNIKIESEIEEGLELLVPAYKNDVTGESDVVEEVLRIYGYNNIPLPKGIRMSISGTVNYNREDLQNIIADYLSNNGFYEMVNNSLSKTKWAEEGAVKILNPLSSDLEVLRQTLIYSGLQAIEYNRNRKHSDLKLFEFGKIYSKQTGPTGDLNLYREDHHLSLFLTGRRHKEQWNSGKENVSTFTIKSYIENILTRCGIEKSRYEEKKVSHPALNGAIEIIIGQTSIVQFGMVNKSLLKQFDITSEVLCADINWDVLEKKAGKKKITFNDLPKFPEVKRDLSMVLNREIQFAEIEKIAFATERKLLKEVNLFDVYEGDKIEKGKKSYAISFILQDMNQTLTDFQIDKVMNRLMESLEKQAGAVIRKS